MMARHFVPWQYEASCKRSQNDCGSLAGQDLGQPH